MGTSKLRVLVISLSVLSCSVLLACGDAQNGDAPRKDTSALDLTKAEMDLLTQAAYVKAKALGYDVSGKHFLLSKEGDAYKGSFYPKEKDALGGGLDVYLDRRGNVIRFLYAP